MPEEENKNALDVGSFAAMEGDDNSIDVSNDAYIGVDAEYRNASEYSGVAINAPQDTSADADPAAAAIEDRAKLYNANSATGPVGPHLAGQGTSVETSDNLIYPSDPVPEVQPAVGGIVPESGDAPVVASVPAPEPAPIEDDPSVASGYYTPPSSNPGE